MIFQGNCNPKDWHSMVLHPQQLNILNYKTDNVDVASMMSWFSTLVVFNLREKNFKSL